MSRAARHSSSPAVGIREGERESGGEGEQRERERDSGVREREGPRAAIAARGMAACRTQSFRLFSALWFG